MMYEDKTAKSVHADAKAAGKDKLGYDNCWSDWQKAALDVLEDGGPQDVKELKVGALTQEQKAAAHAFISKIGNKARRIKSTFPQLSAAALERTQAEASKTLKMAVYGADVSERRAETSNAAFGEDTQNTARETVCEAADSNKRAKTVLATLTCLCEKPDSTEVTDGACTKEAEGTTGWRTAANKAPDDDLVKIVKTCPQPRKKKPYIFRDIRNAIKELSALFHTANGIGYLGAKIGGACDGKKNGGVCIKITGYEAARPAGLDKITWVSAFSNLADHMEERQPQLEAGNRSNKILGDLANEAKHEIKTEKAIQWTGVSGATHSTTAVDKSAPNSVACDHYNRNTTCPKVNFKWEEKTETEGKCKPKEEEEKKNTAETEGGAAKTEKCKDKTEE
uniref:Variant surface glycoprotein 1125.5067 n=1 Tax=Trypanosoma brucei TaxID=5691 RepID=A0A1J0RBS5_9TRYP|nr:variant surface glycoprotein 1125.5067 [Trypanosoma brucei]